MSAADSPKPASVERGGKMGRLTWPADIPRPIVIPPPRETPQPTITPDLRTLTEDDADYARLHAATVRRLDASLAQYVRELRASGGDAHRMAEASSRFVVRHTAELRRAYEAAHREGTRDYYGATSRTSRSPYVAPDLDTTRKRLAFYAPSVAKMAGEGLAAYQATRTPLRASERATGAIRLGGGNPYHKPAGPGGGEFTTGPSTSTKSPTVGHWEGKSTWGGWSDKYKGVTAVVHAENGKATLTLSKHGKVIATHTIEPDMTHGKYQITDHQTGKATHALSLTGVNSHINGEIGGPLSAKGYSLKGGKFVTAENLGAPGPKPSAEQVKINKAAEHAAKVQKFWHNATYGETQAGTHYASGGKSIEYHQPDGSMVRVTRNQDDKSFTVERFNAKAHPKVTPAEAFYDLKMHNGNGETTYADKPSLTKVYKSEKGVDTAIETLGVKSNVKPSKSLMHHNSGGGLAAPQTATAIGVIHNPPPWEPGQGASHEAVEWSHSTTMYNAAMQAHQAGGATVAEARQGDRVGQYQIEIGQRKVTIRATATADGPRLTLTYQQGAKDGETAKGLTVDEAKANLTAHGVHDPVAHLFTEIAAHDAGRYLGATTKDQEARIAAVTARKAELDKKFGDYSQERARELMKAAYAKYPALRTALSAHLSGGAHLEAKSVAGKMIGKANKGLTAEEKLAEGKKALAELREINEWSLLHSPKVTREGTIRLFHGANARSKPGDWQKWLSEPERRGTPFTDKWSVARQFADHGTNGRTVVSAHVPVEHIITHQSIRGDMLYQWENEYTLGSGTISDYDLINLAVPVK